MLRSSELRAIGAAVEADLRQQLDARYPDDRTIGALERQTLDELLTEVHRQRGECVIALHSTGLSDDERDTTWAILYRLGGAYRALRAKLEAIRAALHRFYDLNPDRERRTHPLDHLTGWRITIGQQLKAKGAICRAVRGAGEIGPRWRVGSNNPWGPEESRFDNSETVCPHCGAPSDEFRSEDGREYCPGCGEAWVVGDYDWQSLRDCLAYRDDREAGRVQEDQANGWRGHFDMAVEGRLA